MVPLRKMFGSISLVVIVAASVQGEPTADEIRTGNAASQAAVATFQARVDITIRFNPSQVPSSLAGRPLTDKYVIDYARAGDKERMKELEGPLGVLDIVRDFASNKGSLFVPKGDKTSMNTGILDEENHFAETLHLWQWALFELPWCKQPLSGLLGKAQLTAVKSTTDGGRALVYLDVRDPEGRRYEVWVDPGVNYLVRKLVGHRTLPNGSRARMEEEVVSFREVKPGLFVPERLAHSLSFDGKWFEKGEAALSNIRVNGPLPEGYFALKFPPGTMVSDHERGIGYRVGPGGQPTGVAPVAPAPPLAQVGTQTPLTADERRWHWYHIALIACAALLALGVAGMVWRRRRAAAAG